MKLNKHRLQTKIWRLEATIVALKLILENGQSTTAEIKCYVHIPPDTVNRSFLRRVEKSYKRKTCNGEHSNIISGILKDLVRKGCLQKAKLRKINVYQSTSLTAEALEEYLSILSYHESGSKQA